MQISIKPTNLNFTINTQRQTNQQPVLECRNLVAQQTEQQIGNANNNNALAHSAHCDTNDTKVCIHTHTLNEIKLIQFNF